MNKAEFNSRLKNLKLSIKDFSKISDTSYSTINNWGFSKDDKTIPVPSWVGPFLDNYEKAVKYDYLRNEIFDVMRDVEK